MRIEDKKAGVKESLREWMACIGRMMTLPVIIISMLLFLNSCA